MWLTGFQTFGVIEGMAVGTAVASVFFVYQFAKVQDKWQEVSSRSSVVRPPQERRHLQLGEKEEKSEGPEVFNAEDANFVGMNCSHSDFSLWSVSSSLSLSLLKLLSLLVAVVVM